MGYRKWSAERQAGFQLLLLVAAIALVALGVIGGVVAILLDVAGVI